jgi:hypothetical protein
MIQEGAPAGGNYPKDLSIWRSLENAKQARKWLNLRRKALVRTQAGQRA